MEAILLFLPRLLGLDPETFALLLGVIVAVANLVGRLIPDSATGTLGVIRKIAKVIGLYVGNRVAPGISNNDAAAALAATVPSSVIRDAAESLPDAIAQGQAAGNLAEAILDASPDSLDAPGPNPFEAGAAVLSPRE